MKNFLIGMAAAAVISVSVSGASAATIYDESVNGDLDSIGTTNVNLLLGANEIFGVLPATPPADSDRIKFTQTAGLIVDSILLSFTQPFDDGNNGQSVTTSLSNNVANLFDDNLSPILITSGATLAASFFDSIGPDTGPLSQTTDGAVWDFQISAGLIFPAQPWTLTINTSAAPTAAIPVPAALPLLACGVGILGFLGRRRNKANAV